MRDPVRATTSDDRTMAMLCHLAAFAGFLGIPLGNILGPLIVWLVKRDSPFVDAHGKESVNFQISLFLYGIVLFVVAFVVLLGSAFSPGGTAFAPAFGAFFIGALIVLGLALLGFIAVVVAAVRAANGEQFRYPLSIRFIR